MSFRPKFRMGEVASYGTPGNSVTVRCQGDLRAQSDSKTPLGLSVLRGGYYCQCSIYSAASFSFFSGRTFRRTEAGFAANHLSSPVNGSLPKRFFLAGTS